MAELWWSDQGTLKFDMDNFSAAGSNESARVKEITISGGDRDVEQIKTFGNHARLGLALTEEAANYPNYVMKQMRSEMVEVSITFIAQTDYLIAGWVMGGAVTAAPTLGDYPIYNCGEDTRAAIDIEYIFAQGDDDSEENTGWKFNNAYGTKVEWSVSGGDTIEASMTFKLAGHDCWKAYTNNASDYPISW